ncbi:hypothetical protein [Nocardia sp. NPDC052112]
MIADKLLARPALAQRLRASSKLGPALAISGPVVELTGGRMQGAK